MNTINITEAAQQLFIRLAEAEQRVLLLDYDGTIAPFTPQRDEAVPYPGAGELLQRILAETNTRIVMITGRAAWDLRSLLHLYPSPEIWGSHGMERLWPSGNYEMAEVDERELRGMTAARSAISKRDLQDRIENKPAAVALHWRGLNASKAEAARDVALQAWQPIAEKSGLRLAEFDGGLELRYSNHNKGHAVRKVLDEMGQDSVVAYLGDDQTDEDAFRALRPQDLSVLVRPEFRETSAQLWIKPPEELLQFLGEWLTTCGGVL